MSCGASPIGHKKFCRQCGVALNPEQVICIKCGAATDDSGLSMSDQILTKQLAVQGAQLEVQGAALYQARDLQRTTASGHLLIVATSEYQHFLENEFDPGVKSLERGKNGPGANGCGCVGLAVGALFGLSSCIQIGQPGGEPLFAFFVAVACIGAGMYVSNRQRKAIQAKIDALHQRKADFEKRIADLKSTI